MSSIRKKTFKQIQKEIAELDIHIAHLRADKESLQEILQEVCRHPPKYRSLRGGGNTICDKCDKTVGVGSGKEWTAF